MAATNVGIPRMPITNGGGIPAAQMQAQAEQLTLGERILIGATPIVTVGSLIGLGYPPYAALLRWRICHNPKDAPNKMSFWKVLKTVKQKEGVKGLYKGLLPSLSVGIAPWATVLIGYGVLRTLPRAAPYLVVGSIAQFGWQALTTLITLPFEIIAIRTLAVPHSTPIISPLSNLRLLLTADERSHPFKCLWTPSRILASFLPTILAPLSAALILPQAMKLGEQQGLLIYLISQLILAIGIRTPLAVLAARLNAQRTGGTGAAIVHEKGEEKAEVEGIVQVRPTPYKNLWDCAKTIVAEEGWYALWRGWPLEFLLALRSTA